MFNPSICAAKPDYKGKLSNGIVGEGHWIDSMESYIKEQKNPGYRFCPMANNPKFVQNAVPKPQRRYAIWTSDVPTRENRTIDSKNPESPLTSYFLFFPCFTVIFCPVYPVYPVKIFLKYFSNLLVLYSYSRARCGREISHKGQTGHRKGGITNAPQKQSRQQFYKTNPNWKRCHRQTCLAMDLRNEPSLPRRGYVGLRHRADLIVKGIKKF